MEQPIHHYVMYVVRDKYWAATNVPQLVQTEQPIRLLVIYVLLANNWRMANVKLQEEVDEEVEFTKMTVMAIQIIRQVIMMASVMENQVTSQHQ